MLSDSEPEGEALQQLTINEHYAKAYARKKEREELVKLKEKYGSDVEEEEALDEDAGDEEDDSEDTDEDEEGEELTPAVDAAILRTLARIKRKDPEIYNSQKDVFEEEQEKTKGSSFSFNAKTKKEDKSKPLLFRQHILQSQLQSTSRSPSPELPTHTEEQAALRKETIAAFHTAVSAKHENIDGDDDDGDDGDDILIPRERTKDEIEREQEEYRVFLAREVGEDIGGLVTIERQEGASGTLSEEKGGEEEDKDKDKEEKDAKEKKKKKKRKDRETKDQEDHEFLMNYILNRGWIDKSARSVPKYEEITGFMGTNRELSSAKKEEDEPGRVDIVREARPDNEAESFDEEEFDEVAETFESSYNFRFEEPNAATITTHPRSIEATVRREENPRKAARERKKQRQDEKLLQKREEVKRLKALKMKEIREKLERIGKEGGKSADDEALQQLDLEGDWDPEAHDRQMAGIYGEDEDEVQGGAGDGDEDVDLEKPTWDDDIDITDILPPQEPDEARLGPSSSKAKKKRDKKKRKRDETDLGVDADADADGEDVEGVDVDAMDADADADLNPNSNSNSIKKKKALDEALDEVYGLEFNDLVGDLPTRFKYTPVLPDSYGLSATEILLADDADLNSFVGLRKLAPYRRDRGRLWDSKRPEKMQELRKKLTERRGYGVGGGVEASREGMGMGLGLKTKKRRGKKERQKAKMGAAVMTEEEGDPSHSNRGGESDDRQGLGHDLQDNSKMEKTEGVDGDSESPKKRRKRRHKSSTTQDATES